MFAPCHMTESDRFVSKRSHAAKFSRFAGKFRVRSRSLPARVSRQAKIGKLASGKSELFAPRKEASSSRRSSTVSHHSTGAAYLLVGLKASPVATHTESLAAHQKGHPWDAKRCWFGRPAKEVNSCSAAQVLRNRQEIKQ